MEPLESTSIWMIQSGIAHLLANFPDRSFGDIDRDRYNRVLTTITEETRDFLILHYKATEREDTPFWRYCKDMDIPEKLEEKMQVFLHSGRAFRENEELFTETSWFSVMIGQLMKPRSFDPVAQLMSMDLTQSRLQQIQDAVLNSANHMPTHNDFIRDNCAS
jgi:tryptophan 7-halogenase